MPQVEGYIERKSMLYKTGVEYGDYTLNFVQGCAHGCKYPCYAFMLKRRFGRIKMYEEWLKPYLVSNTLDILDREIPKLRHKIKSVHLCFTTDPLMYGYPEIQDMCIAVIRKLNEAGLKCTVLTKGILPEILAEFSTENEYGITLISLNEKYRERIEPGASPYRDRLESLRRLHDLGCRTWVSVEPYPTPNLIEQDLGEILEEISFTDKIIFGRTNYNAEITKDYPEHRRFYNEQARKVMEFCQRKEIVCYIKEKTITPD